MINRSGAEELKTFMFKDYKTDRSVLLYAVVQDNSMLEFIVQQCDPLMLRTLPIHIVFH